MENNFKYKFKLTKSAINKIKKLINKKKNKKKKFRIYVTGGGCSGFQYGFKFEKKNKLHDVIIKNKKIKIIIDPISIQYLKGGKVDYIENLNGSKFIIKNPNAKSTCSCGASFNT
ncbi:MAG: iron-sulfur cluster insertion protein ErpA [Buchnera aphidicola (Periphyllus lyropictus)]|uniref:iron-sulfur cluster insertion protein ErpA n=1 Tax=Buchnera aphidicola TaxID=9 RepID=UPI001EC4E407|nr:iron-sulfur cluster insertion protein ErpA [Buchnera aphidicola]NIH16649.1 iron-sulfur cluster insertion protein ErpA [Buchnera aphidicola (Periphyllus lyropictus)]USS94559.1 iron-sulfur cluster insertion protein ErpA [Buchnera aphidicola (Periphyllus lyropictus)]